MVRNVDINSSKAKNKIRKRLAAGALCMLTIVGVHQYGVASKTREAKAIHGNTAIVLEVEKKQNQYTKKYYETHQDFINARMNEMIKLLKIEKDSVSIEKIRAEIDCTIMGAFNEFDNKDFSSEKYNSVAVSVDEAIREDVSKTITKEIHPYTDNDGIKHIAGLDHKDEIAELQTKDDVEKDSFKLLGYDALYK
jgi:hypothetical protein